MSSSGSGSDSHPMVLDQRKRKRMQSNRESARRSRMRKQQHLDQLINEVASLQNENERLALQIELISQQSSIHESGNAILRTQLVELTDRLQSLNSVLRFLEEFSGVTMDIPEIPDPLLKPWHLPCPSQPILASTNTFQH